MMETPYLCVLYVATAGQQGPGLGADEEEIVLLVYIVIDMAQNKVRFLFFFLRPAPHGPDIMGPLPCNLAVEIYEVSVICRGHRPMFSECVPQGNQSHKAINFK